MVHSERKQLGYIRNSILLGFIWTGILGGSLAWDLKSTRKDILERARSEAQGAYNKDLLYRRGWPKKEACTQRSPLKHPPIPT